MSRILRGSPNSESIGRIVNSFLQLAGTLKEPSIGVGAAEWIITTGNAVAWGEFSLLAKRLRDRLSAATDICAKRLEPATDNGS